MIIVPFCKCIVITREFKKEDGSVCVELCLTFKKGVVSECPHCGHHMWRDEEIFMNTQLPAILFTQQINQNLQTAPVHGGAVSLPEVYSDENLETAPTANEEPSCSPTGGTQAELPSGVDNKEIDFDEEIDFDTDKSLYSRNIV